MANMSSEMTNKKAYKQLLIEQQCVRNRMVCEHNCRNCLYHCDILQLDKAINFVLDVLKARDPELYFIDSLEQLEILLENDKNQKGDY